MPMPETKELQFDTGLVSYRLNGVCEIAFNPTDAAFVERLYDTFMALDKKQESYEERVSKMADKREVFAFLRERDAEMRQLIDDLFAAPVSGAVFGEMNVYALASGLPVWANLLLAVMDEVDTAFSREQKATNPRVQKYLAKYHR
jgi:hypothetical protein